ncbi:MAG: hypothetical protein EBV06_07200 [Planctomycetia bacterium]|nr:hypothetical protein [Planctomycetia bacterium]
MDCLNSRSQNTFSNCVFQSGSAQYPGPLPDDLTEIVQKWFTLPLHIWQVSLMIIVSPFGG